MIKAVLFDMDGTVLDTERLYTQAWKSALERVGREFSEALFNNCVGTPVYMTKQLVNEHYDDPELFDSALPMAATFAGKYKELNGIPVKAGFHELSDYLKQNGIVSVIATSTSHAAAVEDLTRSGVIDRFIGIVGGDDVKNGKPFPDPYLKAAELAGASVGECIAIEDSVNGIRSALAAEVRCVYVKDFMAIPADVEEQVFEKVERLDEVIGIIDSASHE